MAVTTEKSTQVARIAAGTKGYAADMLGQVEGLKVDFTQSAAAGDAASTVDLCFIPAGRYYFLGPISYLTRDAFGAARVLDIGWTAYTDVDGVAVAASANGLDNDIDVSAAGLTTGLGTALAAGSGREKLFESKTGVLIQAVVAGGTIPAATKINGRIFIAKA